MRLDAISACPTLTMTWAKINTKISGANGHVGSALVKMLDFEKYKYVATDKNEVDITNMDAVHTFCKINRPDIIINCSGLTDLQECETNPDLAYAVNAVGVRNIAQEAQEIGAKLIQISTDDVFSTTDSKVLLNEFDDNLCCFLLCSDVLVAVVRCGFLF